MYVIYPYALIILVEISRGFAEPDGETILNSRFFLTSSA